MTEPVIDPHQEIIDTHHHLQDHPGKSRCLPDDLWADTMNGHHVVKTVFVECGAYYYEDGPGHLEPAGETEFVSEIAEQTRHETLVMVISLVLSTRIPEATRD